MTTTPTSPPSGCDATDSSAPADLWPTPRAYSYDESHTPGLTTLDIRVRGLSPDKKRYWPTGRAVPAPSTSSTAGRPASLLAQRVSALVQAIAGGAGPSSSESLASYNPAGYWQRTQPALFPSSMETGSRPLDEYSQSYPRWGIVSAGASGVLLMSALRISASAFSSWHDDSRAPLASAWPTPTRPNGGRAPKGGMSATGMTPDGIKRQVDLSHHVRNVEQGTDGWPTPRVTAARSSRKALVLEQQWSAPSLEQMAELAQGEIPREYQGGEELTPQARRVYESWATPRASCHDMDTLERSHYAGQRLKEMKQAGQPYRTKTSGMLSARWVCLLMALPADYLSIPPLPGRAGRHARARRKGTTSPQG